MQSSNAFPHAVGQVWEYKHRPQEPESTLTVVKLDHDQNLGVIVHVSVSKLMVKNPHTASGQQSQFSHLPFSATTLSSSVTRKISDHGALGPYQKGYNDWRQAFDSGQGGVWTLSVAETIQAIEDVVKQATR